MVENLQLINQEKHHISNSFENRLKFDIVSRYFIYYYWNLWLQKSELRNRDMADMFS